MPFDLILFQEGVELLAERAVIAVESGADREAGDVLGQDAQVGVGFQLVGHGGLVFKGDIDLARVQGDQHVGDVLILEDFCFRVGAGGIGIVYRAQQHADCLVADIIRVPHFGA